MSNASKQFAPFANIVLTLAWVSFILSAIVVAVAFAGSVMFATESPPEARGTWLFSAFLGSVPGLIGMAASAASGVLAEMSLNQARYQRAMLARTD